MTDPANTDDDGQRVWFRATPEWLAAVDALPPKERLAALDAALRSAIEEEAKPSGTDDGTSA